MANLHYIFKVLLKAGYVLIKTYRNVLYEILRCMELIHAKFTTFETPLYIYNNTHNAIEFKLL